MDIRGFGGLVAAFAAGLCAVASPSAIGQDFNGDGITDLAVGAPLEDVGAIADAGAVTIIYGAGAGLGLEALVPLPSMVITQASFGLDPVEAGDRFGAALAWGNFNGDPFDDLAIGAPGESHPISGMAGAGMVIVLYGSPGGLVPMLPPLFAQDPPVGPAPLGDPAEPGDALGFSLAVGDFNLDGMDDLAMGVPGEDDPSGLADVGIVHVLYGTPGGPLPGPGVPLIFQTAWPWGDALEAGDQFGRTLAAGDMNGDGAADLAIGVPFEDFAGFADAGMVHVAYAVAGAGLVPAPTGQTWTQNSPGVPEVCEAGDRFGDALACGNFDGVAGEDLAIGVPREDFGPNADVGGVAVLYSAGIAGLSAAAAPQPPEWWHQNVAGIPETNGVGDLFGASLAAGMFNLDPFEDLAVGVPMEDSGGGPTPDNGCVNIIHGGPPGLGLDPFFVPAQVWTQNSAGVPDTDQPGDFFGFALTVGDFSGDGLMDLAIGAPGEDLGGGGALIDAGCVFTLYGSPALGLASIGPVGSEQWHQNVAGIPDTNEIGDGWGMTLDNDD